MKELSLALLKSPNLHIQVLSNFPWRWGTP